MGGGRREFLPETEQDIEGEPGRRTDGINLINDWKHLHRRHKAKYVQTKSELLNVSVTVKKKNEEKIEKTKIVGKMADQLNFNALFS